MNTLTPAMENQARFREACRKRGLEPSQELFSLWQDCRATIQPTAAEPVGEIVMHANYSTVVRWLPVMPPSGTKLYAEAVAPADAVRDAERYRWLRDKSEPGICTFYLSVGQAFKNVKFARETVDDAIDAQIEALRHTTPKEPAK